ncbi:MAG TPA: hypothetical protein PLX55_01160 [bacterium]|jgi:hypothetical protein|nr:hypothetical protein [bacterium]HOR57329.1 hypothetical protein [bacterium]HPL56062.1 hypothetical protein [bacterium]HPM27761.1 hypothetical protein [bacterium]
MLKLKRILSTVGLGAFTVLIQAKQVLALNVSSIQEVPVVEGSLREIIDNIVTIVLIAVGIIAVLYLIYGGVLYLTAGGEAEKASKGRTAITNAIIGIVIVMLSLAIYNFVITGVKTGQAN